MEIIKLHGGDTLVTAGEKLNRIYFVAEGSIKVKCPFITGMISKGSIVGIPRDEYVFFPYDYIANENITVCAYDYNGKNDLEAMLKDAGRKNLNAVVVAFLKKIEMAVDAYAVLFDSCVTLIETYDKEYMRYNAQCEALGIEAADLSKYNELCDSFEKIILPEWSMNYLSCVSQKDSSAWNGFLNDILIAIGFIIKLYDDVYMVLMTCSKLAGIRERLYRLFIDPNGKDILGDYMSMLSMVYKSDDDVKKKSIRETVNLYMDVVRKVSNADEVTLNKRFRVYNEIVYSDLQEIDAWDLEEGINPEDIPEGMDSKRFVEIIKSLKDSRFTILDLLGIDHELQNKTISLLDSFVRMSDKNSLKDDDMALRRELTKCFMLVYEIGFLKWVKEREMPIILKMFFNLGFFDERLLSKKNQAKAYDIIANWIEDKQGTFFLGFEWLKAVYEGRRDTSFDEFSVDYAGHLNKLKMAGKITETEEARDLRDNEKRTSFEIRNMFKNAMLLTSGRISTYVPMLSESVIVRPLEAMLVDCKEVKRIIDKVRTIDFYCFYRQKLYSNPEIGINREYVGVEVLPEIVFVPVIGNRSVMWQEITGKMRISPARFVLPLFAADNLAKLVLRMVGEFRWEMCKRVQGNRWNDISEPSLTSDYYGYLDSYKKNKELSPEIRDKIKLAYVKCKNNIREMFVCDYIDYLCFEAKGTLKLNRVARSILLTYCPFNAEIRSNLAGNNLYREILERYEAKTEHEVHLLDVTIRKVESKGKEVPAELLEQRKLLRR